MPEHVGCYMKINGCKLGIFVYHSPYSLIGEGIAGLICKKMITVINFITEGGTVFFQYVDNRHSANLDFTFL